MLGKVLHVNVSPGGVPKRTVEECYINPLGLEGDSHAHPKVHGGPRQAVLIIAMEAIEELKALGFPLYPGALGENLTTEGLDRTKMRVGQHYRAGDAILEITKLRQPCKTLLAYGEGIQKAVYDEQVKAGDHSSERWGLAGFYASVVQPGRISTGAPIMLIGQQA
jgi:MOSC domain-containing protein YiiM